MSFDFYYVALLFFIYSFLGWCVEVAFVAITARKVENRGFLNGPVCPIYGCGMLGVLAALTPYRDNFILLFIGGFIICTAVELFGGWVLDKIFHMRWWDYTKNKFNIGGYVCLRFSIMWGLGVVAVMKLVHPPIFALVRRLPKIAGFIYTERYSCYYFCNGSGWSLLRILLVSVRVWDSSDKVAEDLNNLGNQIKDVVGNSAINVADRAEGRVLRSLTRELKKAERSGPMSVKLQKKKLQKQLNRQEKNLQRQLSRLKKNLQVREKLLGRNLQVQVMQLKS